MSYKNRLWTVDKNDYYSTAENNNIQTFDPDMFRGMTKLEQILLSNNDPIYFGPLPDLESLTKIDLSSNRIEALGALFLNSSVSQDFKEL